MATPSGRRPTGPSGRGATRQPSGRGELAGESSEPVQEPADKAAPASKRETQRKRSSSSSSPPKRSAGTGRPRRRSPVTGRFESDPPPSDWIMPPTEERGFSRYLAAIWAGRWIVAVAVACALAGAAVYLAGASKVYEAHSQLLITPLPPSSTVSGLGLITGSADPLRDVETAAGFVTTTSVAQRVVSSLHLRESPAAALAQIMIAPIAESNIVDIGARASSAGRAQRLANEFAIQTVVDRTANLDDQLRVLIPRVQAQIAAVGSSNPGVSGPLSGQLAELQTLSAGSDPNMHVSALASLPGSPISPRRSLTIAAALIAGLVIGLGLVFLVQLANPRIQREEELRARFRLPVLARVPRIRAGRWPRIRAGKWPRRQGPLAPGAITPEARDAFRALHSVLSAARPQATGGRSVLITGGSPQDGKSTTAINLACAFADAGERVILMECDSRRPSLGPALNLSSPNDIKSVAYGGCEVDEALLTNGTRAELRVLLASQNGRPGLDVAPAVLNDILLAALRSSDWVVLDAPALIYAPEVLSAPTLLDDVLLVVRLGHTGVRDLEETAEMLAHHGIRPAGLVVVGTSAHRTYY
jgi:polysaccharide biosynthesis transport protein